MFRTSYDRRDFLKTAGGGAAAMFLLRGRSGRAARPGADRPNIVLVIADDQTWSDSNCYGNTQLKTPNIDKLAAQGMRFTHCFTATAMCAPTRQQLYTGIFPVRNGAYPNHSRVKRGTKSIVHHLRGLGYRVGLHGKRHFGPRDSFPFEKVGGGIEKFINRDKKQPYCLVYASHSPHCPWNQGKHEYDPAELQVPPYLVDNKETRAVLAKYCAEVTDFDREVGRCMKAVEKAGDFEDTVFIYTSEQGAQFPFGKWTCYDLGLHTALVMRWPERVKAGSVSKAMVQYVDVVPTLIAAAGGDPIPGLDGKSFLPVLEGKTDEHNDVVFGVHTTRGIILGSQCYPIRSIRTRTHKYIMNLNSDTKFQNILTERDRQDYWRSWVRDAAKDPAIAERVKMYQHRPAEEFYDLTKDPFEHHNLAGDPQYREQMDELKKRLKAWMKQQGDEGVATEMKVRAHRSVRKEKKKK